MGKLRHIAITAEDPDATARFYETTFGMQRVWSREIGVMLSDGTVSLAVLATGLPPSQHGLLG